MSDIRPPEPEVHADQLPIAAPTYRKVGEGEAVLPTQHVTEPPREAGEMHFIRRPVWEGLERCVTRLREPDPFYSSWTSFCLGLGFSALVGFFTVLTTSSQATPHTAALELLGGLAVVTFFLAWMIHRIELRERRNRVSQVSALEEEMEACRRYMVADEIQREGVPVTLPSPVGTSASDLRSGR